MPAGQRRAADLITDGCELPRGCCELNPGPLKEQLVLLTAEPSLQPDFSKFTKYKWTGHCKCNSYLIIVLIVYSFTVLELKPFLFI